MWRILVLTCCITLLPGCKASNTSPPQNSGARTVAKYSSQPFSFELSVGACVNGECPILVVLSDETRQLDSFKLPVAASTQEMSEDTVDLLWGADPGQQAWSAGEESTYVGIAARLVQFTRDRVGLLVTQRYGFEHLKRWHSVFLPRGGKLWSAWEASDSAGPAWSATHVMDGPERTQWIAHFRGFFAETESEPDRLEVSRLRITAAGDSLEEVPLPSSDIPLYAVQAASFANVTAARRAKAAAECLASSAVLSGADYPDMGSDMVFIGFLFEARSKADAFADSISSCMGRPVASIVQLQRRK